jgi:hypothetical protein
MVKIVCGPNRMKPGNQPFNIQGTLSLLLACLSTVSNDSLLSEPMSRVFSTSADISPLKYRHIKERMCRTYTKPRQRLPGTKASPISELTPAYSSFSCKF